MRQPAPRQFSLPSWFTNCLQPSFDTIQARAWASCLELVEPLPSPFVRVRLVCCSWQNSRREILRAKSQSLSSTVNVERRGNRASNTLTGADGLYNGRSVSRQNQPQLGTRLNYCASAPAVVGPPVDWAVLRFLVKWVGRRECAPCKCRSVCNSERSAGGKRARAWRIESSRARGPRHENAF